MIFIAAIITVEARDVAEVQDALERALGTGTFAPAVGVAAIPESPPRSVFKSVSAAMKVAVDRAAAANRDGL